MKLQKSVPVILAILLGLPCCFSSFAQHSIPFENALKDASVALTSMQDGQRESLILGNGDLYGIVWEEGGGLFMRITKNDIWDARCRTPIPTRGAALAASMQ